MHLFSLIASELFYTQTLFYLCKGIECSTFTNQHVGKLSKHGVLQYKEGLVWDAKSRHEHNHLPVEMQMTYNTTSRVVEMESWICT